MGLGLSVMMAFSNDDWWCKLVSVSGRQDLHLKATEFVEHPSCFWLQKQNVMSNY